jgi:starvation-inducible DNA-binding protein
MTTRVSPIGVDVERIESELRPLQMDMIALALQGKQLHWNLQGRQFMSLHMQLDGIVDDARGWVDELAERLVTLGVWADGQPADVARESTLDEMPKGAVSDMDALGLMSERIARLATNARACATNLGEIDIASQDLCLDILRSLEKHLWMLRAQQP